MEFIITSLKIKILLTVAIFFCLQSTAQDTASKKNIIQSEQKKFPNFVIYAGVGLGIDYAGLGGKVEYVPIKWVGTFLSAGYNFFEWTTVVGVSGKLLPDFIVQPVILGMYGYNGAIIVSNKPELSKTYYGFSAGAGAEIKFGKQKHKLTFEIIKPFRSNEFMNYYNKLDKDPSLSFSNKLKDYSLTIGLNLCLN